MPAKRKPRAAQLGVTDDEYDRLLAAQGGGCAICGNPPKTRRLHVDHDHKTGRVRGLLCHRCNRALPNWVTAGWLQAAATYLGRVPLCYRCRRELPIEAFAIDRSKTSGRKSICKACDAADHRLSA